MRQISTPRVILGRRIAWQGWKFEPRDVWVGWYWDRKEDGTHHYVCPLPMVRAHWVRT